LISTGKKRKDIKNEIFRHIDQRLQFGVNISILGKVRDGREDKSTSIKRKKEDAENGISRYIDQRQQSGVDISISGKI
jgi:hypothetical protein